MPTIPSLDDELQRKENFDADDQRERRDAEIKNSVKGNKSVGFESEDITPAELQRMYDNSTRPTDDVSEDESIKLKVDTSIEPNFEEIPVEEEPEERLPEEVSEQPQNNVEDEDEEDELVIVPDVVEQDVAEAQSALMEVGLKSFISITKSKGGPPTPVVESTIPQAGTEAKKGQIITLNVIQNEQDEEDKDKEKKDDEEPEEKEPKPEAQAGKGLGEAAEVGEGAEGAEAAVAVVGTSEIWGPILAIIAAIVAAICLFLLTVGFVILIFVAGCNMNGAKGVGVRAVSTVGTWLGFLPVDVCAKLQLGSSVAPSGTTGVNPQPSGDEAANRALLAGAGIDVNKACVDPTRLVGGNGQTCIGGTRPGTLEEIIKFAKACDLALAPNGPPGNRCGVILTGGSELGHSGGDCSHGSGHKVDIDDNSAVNNYILNPANFTYIGDRINRDGSRDPQYQNNVTGVIYVRESNHWDIGGVGCA